MIETTRKYIQDIASLDERKAIVLVFCDSAYSEVLHNWLLHIQKLSIENYLVVALDDDLHESLVSRGIHSVSGRNVSSFEDLWNYRISFIRKILELDINVAHTDADAVWLEDPLPSLLGDLTTDLVFSQGTIWPDDIHAKWGLVLCCGLFSVRANTKTIEFFKRWENELSIDGDDQRVLNRLLAGDGLVWTADPDYDLEFKGKRFRCFNNLVTGSGGNLEVSLLPHGSYQRLLEPSKNATVMHILSDKNENSVVETMKQAGCWESTLHLESEY